MPDSDLRFEVADLTDRPLLQATSAHSAALTADEIHVWQFPLIHAAAELADYRNLLSRDELTRAARFHFERDANRFIIARAGMRSIMAAYTGSSPYELKFSYSLKGKPSLAQPTSGIRFNLSHSADLGLVAVVLGYEIGVDVEAIRPDVDTDKLAERFFSPRERSTLRALAPDQRVDAFFRCWTCKEAFLKGQGFGLSRSLDSFDVEVDPSRPASLLETRPDPQEAQRWTLRDIETTPGYAAAVALEGRFSSIKIFRAAA